MSDTYPKFMPDLGCPKCWKIAVHMMDHQGTLRCASCGYEIPDDEEAKP